MLSVVEFRSHTWCVSIIEATPTSWNNKMPDTLHLPLTMPDTSILSLPARELQYTIFLASHSASYSTLTDVANVPSSGWPLALCSCYHASTEIILEHQCGINWSCVGYLLTSRGHWTVYVCAPHLLTLMVLSYEPLNSFVCPGALNTARAYTVPTWPWVGEKEWKIWLLHIIYVAASSVGQPKSIVKENTQVCMTMYKVAWNTVVNNTASSWHKNDWWLYKHICTKCCSYSSNIGVTAAAAVIGKNMKSSHHYH